MYLHLSFLHIVVVGATHSRAVRFDDEHCRCSRPCGSRDNCWERCVGITGKCRQSMSCGVGHSRALSTVVAKSSGSSTGCSRTRAGLASSHQSRFFSNHVESVQGKLLDCQMWIPILASLLVPQQLLSSEADRQGDGRCQQPSTSRTKRKSPLKVGHRSKFTSKTTSTRQ